MYYASDARIDGSDRELSVKGVKRPYAVTELWWDKRHNLGTVEGRTDADDSSNRD